MWFVFYFFIKKINLWDLNKVIKYYGNYKSIENDIVKIIEWYNFLNVVLIVLK